MINLKHGISKFKNTIDYLVVGGLTALLLLIITVMLGSAFEASKEEKNWSTSSVEAKLEERGSSSPVLETRVSRGTFEARTAETPAVVTSSRYSLTDAERKLVLGVVMAEARGEPYEGQMMIAQCIMDGAERNNLSIADSISAYQIVVSDMEPSDTAVEAVSAVFDRGERVTEALADLWYAPGICNSGWHEKQQYVCTIGGHKFFWCNANIN